jgi:tetratricopeptide (TPR) repeat protein
MSENRREQIKKNLLNRDTEYLLDIWQNGGDDEWEKDVFEMIKEILLDRLGHVPPQSVERQVSQILHRVEDYLENKDLDKALTECESAIQLSPDSAIAYNYLGEIYAEMGQPDNAIVNYQKAIQLDSEYQDAWENMLSIESELEEAFEESIAKQHLDNALEFAYSHELEKALAALDIARPLIPNLAVAYNYLGLILQTLEQLEPAIDSYLKAIQLNPRFYVARKNLANARVQWEEEQYFIFSELSPAEEQDTITDFVESEPQESGEPVPQWLYMDKNAFLLAGWAGHRTRYGRSGYDPLETDFELARMQGIVIRLLLTRKFRTRNPIYLLFMAFVGGLYFLCGVLIFTLGNAYGIIMGIVYSPYSIVGALLLVNVYLSLRLEKHDGTEDNGYTFF